MVTPWPAECVTRHATWASVCLLVIIEIISSGSSGTCGASWCMLEVRAYEGELMTQHAPNPLRRFWWLTAVWVPAVAVEVVLSVIVDRSLFIALLALVGWFLWFTISRHPGSERLAVHLLFCLFALSMAAMTYVGAFHMLTHGDMPIVPVSRPVMTPRR